MLTKTLDLLAISRFRGWVIPVQAEKLDILGLSGDTCSLLGDFL